MPGSLIWTVDSPIMPKPEAYRAPSWSWASVDGSINWPDHSEAQPLATVHSPSILHHTHYNPFGQVTEGSLGLRGKALAPLQLRINPLSNRRSQYRLRNSSGRDLKLSFQRRHPRKDPHIHRGMHYIWTDHTQNYEGEEVMCMPLTSDRNIECLLIMKTKGDPLGRYERIGVNYFSDDYRLIVESSDAGDVERAALGCSLVDVDIVLI